MNNETLTSMTEKYGNEVPMEQGQFQVDFAIINLYERQVSNTAGAHLNMKEVNVLYVIMNLARSNPFVAFLVVLLIICVILLFTGQCKKIGPCVKSIVKRLQKKEGNEVQLEKVGQNPTDGKQTEGNDGVPTSMYNDIKAPSNDMKA